MSTLTFDAPALAVRAWWMAAAACLVAGLATLVAQRFDGRQIADVGVWVKPAKFGFSLALHFATLALVAAWLSPETAGRWVLPALVVLSVGAAAVEMVWIIRQASRAELSHFNIATPFHAAMYQVMAVGAVMIIGAAGVLGALVAVDQGWSHGGVLRWGIALGLIAGTLLTLFTAFSIGSAMSPYVGTGAAAESAMPITGWSLTRGDLRVSHFLATHMLQVIPIAALVLDRWLDPQRAMIAVMVATLVWTALTIGTWVQAKSGMPLGWTWA